MWNLVLVHLELVFVLVQDKCTVCAKRTVGSDIVMDAPDGLLGDVGHVESRSVRLEMVLVLVQDRCTVCVQRTIGPYVVLDAPDCNPR